MTVGNQSRIVTTALGVALLAGGALLGCGGQQTTNMSPTADEAPDRYEKAKAEAAAREARNRELEAKAFGGAPVE